MYAYGPPGNAMTRKSRKSQHALLVQYKLVNGSHFFVGQDGCEETAGLCVGSRDLRKAFDQVGPALTYLLKKNHEIDVVCVPSRTFHEFREWLLARISGDLLSGIGASAFDSNPVLASDDLGKARQWTIPTVPNTRLSVNAN